MRKLLQKLPFAVEFAVILAGAFGYAVVVSSLALVQHKASAGPTEFGIWRVVGLDLIILLVLGAFLWARGWKAARLGLESDWRDGLWALALAVGSFAAVYLFAMMVSSLMPGVIPHDAKPPPPSLSVYAVAALVLVNGFYEEFFAAGYVVSALKEKGHPDLGINLGIALRVAIHIFQGAAGVILMVPIGLVFGTWFAKTGKLWPLILAHTLLNAWSYAHYIKW